ncbi:hypothetical protein ACEU0C_003782 [Stenotrophomonas indicatrix]|uniref:hypothetical protein n=1 Tax=Stenotrophomonas indicatrix TaxID=2045451 RepID=UPI00372E0E9D
MDDTPTLPRLQQSLRRLQYLVAALATLLLVLAGMTGWLLLQRNAPLHADSISTQRLQVLDDRGVVRVQIGQDANDGDRRSRSAGLLIFDRSGVERGGLSTFEDGSTALALDAPLGMGDARWRDRAGLRVDADGSAQLLLTDNLTRGVVRLHSKGSGGGGMDTFRWDMSNGTLHTRTLTYDGDERSQRAFDL